MNSIINLLWFFVHPERYSPLRWLTDKEIDSWAVQPLADLIAWAILCRDLEGQTAFAMPSADTADLSADDLELEILSETIGRPAALKGGSA